MDLPQGYEAALLSHKRDAEPDPQLRFYRPLLEALPTLLSRGVELYCYVSPAYYAATNRLAYELVALGIGARLGKIDVEKWRKLVEQHILVSLSFADQHLDYVVSRAKTINVCVNLPEEVKQGLLRRGQRVVEVALEEPCRPLGPLWDMVKASLLFGRSFDTQKARKIIEEYASFLGLVMEKGFEEACASWKRSHGRRPNRSFAWHTAGCGRSGDLHEP